MAIIKLPHNTWFWSDTHYGHKNIVLGETEWTDAQRCRPFANRAEMNDHLVSVCNAVAGPSDTLVHLGDWSFGPQSNIREFRHRLHVGTIHWVLGNHDHDKVDAEDIAQLVADGTFASIGERMDAVIDGQLIICAHYAQRVWNFQTKNSWHLYGHSHGTLQELENYSTDVGYDGIHGPHPVAFAQLKQVFAAHSKKNRELDHHTQ
jgi:calcineurin-like phosphoesterase family protein